MTDWLDRAVFYEIYPQSFQDSNGDGIGDINGIISRLDYIRELGCNAIWINPCFDSPFFDAGYDVSDYCRVAARYGTNEDMAHLFDQAHRRRMHVLLDLVPGHTSIQHPWFRESMKPERNQYSDRYVWTDSVWTPDPDNPCLRGISERDGCAVVNFFSTQPALNYGYFEPAEPWQQSMEDEGPRQTLEAMQDVMRFWLDYGCDGFRCDMAGSLVKNDPQQKGTMQVWRKVRRMLDEEYPDAVLISEWGEPEKSLAGGFHMDFLLHFGPSHYNDLFRCEAPYFSRADHGSAQAFVSKYLENMTRCGGQGLICIPSGNHDMDRLARRLSQEEMKTAFAFLLSMPGAPFIYYGDEIGMRYMEGLCSKEGGFGRTGSRTPMQWDDSENAGFSTASPEDLYLPQDPRTDRATVLRQMEDPESLWHTVKKLIGIRQEHPALQNGAGIRFIADGEPLAYWRQAENERILVVINPGPHKRELAVELHQPEVLYVHGSQPRITKGRIQAAPASAVFIREVIGR